jgi:hypothetical protein
VPERTLTPEKRTWLDSAMKALVVRVAEVEAAQAPTDKLKMADRGPRKEGRP